jgi:hypothetical protein
MKVGISTTWKGTKMVMTNMANSVLRPRNCILAKAKPVVTTRMSWASVTAMVKIAEFTMAAPSRKTRAALMFSKCHSVGHQVGG